MAEEWSDWRNVEPGSLVYDVADVFACEWEPHDVEYRLVDGTVISGQIWTNEEPYTYTDSDGDEVFDWYHEYNIEDASGNSIPTETVIEWRYKK